MKERAQWYVIHTYSGYENKVKANLEKTIENRNFGDYILDLQVPVEQHIEEKDGKTKITMKKKFPGYVLVKMIMTDDSWYIIRNTRGVTGFVGPGSKPIPLTDEEIQSMGITEKSIQVDVSPGETVRIISGPFENYVAVVKEINLEKRKIKALVDMFGRETPVELEFNKIEKFD